MRTAELEITCRLRPKVLLVPRKKNIDHSNEKTIDQMIAALKIPSPERTDQDVDTLLSTVGKWPCFTNAVHSEQMRREVCRQMVYDERPANTILFKQDDEPNGWFIVVTGECKVVKVITDDAFMNDMPPIMVQKLKEAHGPDKFFRAVFTAGPKLEFGSVALINDCPRNATIYISQPSILIRVDNQIYRDTAKFFARTQLIKRANVISHIKEFSILHTVRDANGEEGDTFIRLAENTVDFNLPAGTILDKQHTTLITVPVKFDPNGKTENEIKTFYDNERAKTQGFFVVAQGKLTVHRLVNFSDYKGNNSKDIKDDVLAVRLPHGQHLIQIAELGPKTMFPDPRLEDGWIKHQFTLKVAEPCLLHNLKLNDLTSAITQNNLEKIKERILDQPDDQKIIEMWIEKQRAAQWLAYKNQCVKEAKKVIALERQIMNGEYGMRKAGIPKSIKEHDPFPPLRKSSFSDLEAIEREKMKRREKEKAFQTRKMNEMRKAIESRVQAEAQRSEEIQKRREEKLNYARKKSSLGGSASSRA